MTPEELRQRCQNAKEVQRRLELVYRLFADAGAKPYRLPTRLSPVEQSDFSLVWPFIARGYILEPHAFTDGASTGSRRGWIVSANGGYKSKFARLLSSAKAEWALDVAVRLGWMVKLEHPKPHGVGNPQPTPLYAMTPKCLRKWIHRTLVMPQCYW